MKKLSNESGMGAVEALLILIVVGIIGFTGWFVWQSQKNASDTLDEANNSKSADYTSAVSSYADCVKAKGSMLQETYPEVCVTKTGQRFANPSQQVSETPKTSYLIIKEWGVKFPYDGSETTLSYRLTGSDSATIVSSKLSEKYEGCNDYGAGIIGRGEGTDSADANGATYAEYKKQNNDGIGQIGQYYYMFTHDQAGCAPSSLSDQNAANDFVKNIVRNVQAT